MIDNYLVDTHTFLWWVLKQPGLSRKAVVILEDKNNEVILSAATCWEVLIKYRIGKLSIPSDLAGDLESVAIAAGFRLLPITFAHAQRTGLLPQFKDHRDPFDRLLVAQTMVEGFRLLSNDARLDRYDISRVW